MKIKSFIPVLVAALIPHLHAEERVYSQSDLEKWELVDRPLLDSCPDAKQIYEFYDLKQGVSVKLFVDERTNRAFVVFWPNDVDVVCEKNGEAASSKDVFKVLAVKAYEVEKHEGPQGNWVKVENREKTVSCDVGAWFQRPGSGVLKITATRSGTRMGITWNASDKWPEVDLQSSKPKKSTEQAVPPNGP